MAGSTAWPRPCGRCSAPPPPPKARSSNWWPRPTTNPGDGVRFTVVTLFPESLVSPLGSSILGQAKKKGLWDWQPLALRSYCPDKHATADDHPFGGGAGMVLKAEPVLSAWPRPG